MNLDTIDYISKSRPGANHSVEQYLMTKDSLLLQKELLNPYLKDKKVVYIGDDDHLSLIFSLYSNSESIVLELDDRIIKNQKKIKDELKIHNHKIFKYDVSDDIPYTYQNTFDAFIINPPYGSKNQAYGSKVWISRALKCLKTGGIGITVLPFFFEKKWSIENMLIVQKFLTLNNCLIIKIDNDKHSYEDLPAKDTLMRSSNIIIQYLGNASNLIDKVDQNLYR